jgi:hypothetical protein
MGFISLSLTCNVFRVYIQGRVYRRILIYTDVQAYTRVYMSRRTYVRENKHCLGVEVQKKLVGRTDVLYFSNLTPARLLMSVVDYLVD